jgi:transposase
MQKREQSLTHSQRKQLLQSLETDVRPEYRCRIQIMLMADEGHTQQQICETLRCSPGTARYWIAMAQTGKALRWYEQPVGRPKVVDEQYRDRLRELVNCSPQDYGYGFRRWTAHWLGKHLAKEFEIQVSDRYINYLLKKMGLSTRGQKPAAQVVDVPSANIRSSANITSADATSFVAGRL